MECVAASIQKYQSIEKALKFFGVLPSLIPNEWGFLSYFAEKNDSTLIPTRPNVLVLCRVCCFKALARVSNKNFTEEE